MEYSAYALNFSIGNFRNLLKYRAKSGDVILRNNLEDFKKNAAYMSPDIQNEVVETCGDVILQSILSDAKEVTIYK